MTTDDLQEAFVDRLNEHRGILLKVANAYCRDPANREDLIQSIIVQLWRAYGRFDGRSSFSTWMYRIAVNVAISFYRREIRRVRRAVPAEESVVESVASPAQEEETSDRLALMYEFIERLDELNRALMLLYLDGNPYGEVAKILGISETNVATKISRIKKTLKREIAGQIKN